MQIKLAHYGEANFIIYKKNLDLPKKKEKNKQLLIILTDGRCNLCDIKIFIHNLNLILGYRCMLINGKSTLIKMFKV